MYAQVGTITYIRTRRGFVYLAVVMDLFSRRVIGWHVSERIEHFASIDFRGVDHVRYQATLFIDHVYNQRRLHSTLGYQSPIQFERAHIRQQQLTNTVA